MRTDQARIVVLGKQGSGKGTQCELLADHFGLVHLATGDLLRAAVRDRTPLGRRAQALMENGELVSDDLVFALLDEELRRAAGRGFSLDGVPRTLAQARALDRHLGDHGLDAAVELDVPGDLVMRRMATRRVCPTCGTLTTAPDPAVATVPCQRCDGTAVARPDDTVDAIARRLALYEEETRPVLDWYEERRLLVRVDGDGDPEEVFGRVLASLEVQLSPAPSPR